MKKICCFLALLASGFLMASPTITSVTARQRYPWNGLVDITVVFAGASNVVAETSCLFVATNSATHVALPIEHISCTGADFGSGDVWTRRLLWDATADLGQVKIADVALSISCICGLEGGVQLWENGPFWAECNIGATRPEEAGYYFWWGDTVGYVRSGGTYERRLNAYSDVTWVSSDGEVMSSSPFDSDACPTEGKSEAQLQALGYTDSAGKLVAEHDAATAHLGATWRMPTIMDFDALVRNCHLEWTTCNGVNGYLVRGEGSYVSKSIFLPAAGAGVGTTFFGLGFSGDYWFSELRSDRCSFALNFESDFIDCFAFDDRSAGCPVRALSDLSGNVGQGHLEGMTTHLSIDCRTETRIATTTERICFSPMWATDVEGAVATVCIDGVAVTNVAATGVFDWSPREVGPHVLSYAVYTNAVQVGETLFAAFEVERPKGNPVISAVSARQRYPWNGLVDIVVTFEGPSNDVAMADCVFFATNGATRAALPVTHVTRVGDDSEVGTTWTRRFVWNATADVGETKIDDVALAVGVGRPDGCVQLWENGPYWAECNIGATEPEERGYYFWWGDTVGYMRELGAKFEGFDDYTDVTWVSSLGTHMGNSPFDLNTCPTYDRAASQLQKAGFADSSGKLVAACDAATVHLGTPWRMPTVAEFDALVRNCDSEWMERNGVYGRLVKGRGAFASRSIFIPVAGQGYASSLFESNTYGMYWSSELYSGSFTIAMCLVLDSTVFVRTSEVRYIGCPVRPLRELPEVLAGTVITHLPLDTRTGTRVAGRTEQIGFSPAWAADLDGAMVTVSIGETVVTNATKAGVFEWTPSENGIYDFTHVVSVGGSPVGETLSASFSVEGIFFETQTTEVPVPYAWLREQFPGIADDKDVYEAQAKASAANGRSVCECYVAGLSATDPKSEFRATITCADGVVKIGWTPNLNTGSVTRIYKVYGRTRLDADEWETPARPWHRFFKVSVSMPTGAEGEVTAVSNEGFVPRPELGSVQLWENGPYWAECNVGATKPEECGYYFYWGDTVGYSYEGGILMDDNPYRTDDKAYSNVTWVSSSGIRISGSPFDAASCPMCRMTISECKSLGYIDATGNLTATFDAATAHLGPSWRMPTDAEFAALIKNCDAEWTMRNGVYGRLMKGRGVFASRSIFLPFSGYGLGTTLDNCLYGYYWSSTSSTGGTFGCWGLRFGAGVFTRGIGMCYRGQPVRPICEVAK